MHKIINDREMRDAAILIFANKQDLPGGLYLIYNKRFFSCFLNFSTTIFFLFMLTLELIFPRFDKKCMTFHNFLNILARNFANILI